MSSSWAVTALTPSYRFTLGSVAGGKSHAPLAPCIPSPHHPPTCLCAYLPPALCCPHKKRVREIEDNGPSIAPSHAYKSNGRSPALREVLPLFLTPSPSIPLSHSVLSLASLHAMGKPMKSGFFCTCVSDQKREDKAGGEGRFLSLVFGFRLPTVFLLLLLLLPSFIPPFSSSFYPKGDSLIRRYWSAIPSSLSVAL